MPTPVTEIAFLPLAANAQIENASSQAGRKWKAIVDTVADQAGFVGGFLGRQIEDDTIVMHLVDWDSIESHRHFMSLPAHDTVMADLETILRGDPPFYHVYLYSQSNTQTVTTLSNLFKQAVPGFTQILTLYLSPDTTSSEASALEKTWRTSCCNILEKAQGFICVAGGWAVEELDKREVPGGKAKAFCIIEGWESVEKYREFNKTETHENFGGFGPLVKFSEACGTKLVAQ